MPEGREDLQTSFSKALSKPLSRRQFLRVGTEAAVLGSAYIFLGCGRDSQAKTSSKQPEHGAKASDQRQARSGELESKSTSTFIFGEGVDETIRQEIKDAIGGAEKWFSSKTGVNVDGVSIFAFNDNNKLVDEYLKRTNRPQSEHEKARADLRLATAFIGEGQDLYISTASPGWMRASPIIGGPVKEGRYHTAVHEWFHLIQQKLKAYEGKSFPMWLNEGGAHYIASRFIADNNIYEYDKIKNGHITGSRGVADSLKTMETVEGFYKAGNPASADEYSLGFLAVDKLVSKLPEGGVPKLVRFWQDVGEGISWQSVFEQNFGKSPEAFYSEFAAHRASGFKN